MEDKSRDKLDNFFKNFNKMYKRGIKAEKNAIKILNSKETNHIWRKDFKKNTEPHEDWDLINSENVKIEVKSTIKPYSFSRLYCKLNTKNQHKQIIMKVLTNKRGEIKSYKFVKKRGKKWTDITDKILCKK